MLDDDESHSLYHVFSSDQWSSTNQLVDGVNFCGRSGNEAGTGVCNGFTTLFAKRLVTDLDTKNNENSLKYKDNVRTLQSNYSTEWEEAISKIPLPEKVKLKSVGSSDRVVKAAYRHLTCPF